MFEPFVLDYFSKERKVQLTLPSWVGWELILVLVFLGVLWWCCGGTVTAFLGGPWDPAKWTLV